MKVNAATGDVTMAWRDRRAIVLHRAAFVCEECKVATATEVDHIWPKSWGGQDDLDNLRATCLPCNRSKGGKALLKDLTEQRADWASNHFMWQAWTAITQAVRFERVSERLAGDWEDALDPEQVWTEAAAEWAGDVLTAVRNAIDEGVHPGPQWSERASWSAADAASYAGALARRAARATKAEADFKETYEVLLPLLEDGMSWREAWNRQCDEMEAAGMEAPQHLGAEP